MAEYIDREAVFKAYEEVQRRNGPWRFETLIESVPAADVAPVVHGKWVDKPTGRYGQMQSWCTACGEHSGIGGIKKNRHKPYCPNCGAKMDDPKGD